MSEFVNCFILLEIMNFVFQSIHDSKQKWYYSHGILLVIPLCGAIFNLLDVHLLNPMSIHIVALYIFYKLYNMDILRSGTIVVLNLINYYTSQYLTYVLCRLCFSKDTGFEFIITLLFCFLLSFMIIRMCCHAEENQNTDNKMIFTLPIVTVVIMAISQNMEVNRKWFIALIVFGLFVSNYITFYYFFKAMENLRLKNELDIKRNQLLISKQHTELLNKQYRSNFEYFHLLLHRINDINTKIGIRDEKVKSELSKLMGDIDARFNNTLTNSFVLNTVIQSNFNSVDANNIKIRSTMFESLYFLEFEEQIELFDMILKKGIENCMSVKEEDRIIIIQSKPIQNELVLKWTIPNNGKEDDFIEKLYDKIHYRMKIHKTVDEELGFETYSIVFLNVISE